MRTGVLAKKLGMTRIYDEMRSHNGVTVLQMPDNVILSHKLIEKHGYNALVVGFEKIKPSRSKKPQKSFYAKLKIEPLKKIKEFRISKDNFVETGESLCASHFVIGQFVDVQSLSIGKGFAGAMKRHNFAGLRASHGVSVSHRSHGSTGNSQDPGRVWRGKKMAGQLGNKIVSVQNLEVVSIDDERGLILVKGGVPGSIGSWVQISDAKKKSLPPNSPLPAGLKSKNKKTEANTNNGNDYSEKQNLKPKSNTSETTSEKAETEEKKTDENS